MPTPQPRLHRSRSAGFSLIELAVVGTIIGILAALAVPYFKKVRDRSAMSAFQHDIRLFEQEFDTYELENKFFPPSQSVPGQYPLGMADRLSEAWKLPSAIGGVYRWVYTTEDDLSARNAYIEIVPTSEEPFIIDPEQFARIDDDIDDGVPSTGIFQIHGLNVRYYIR